MDVSFEVVGTPRPQGSKRAFVNKHTGRAQMTEQSKHVYTWRDDIRSAAARAMGAAMPTGKAVRVLAEFIVARPKADFGTGKNADALKPSAPIHPIKKTSGDIDKLLRALFDAMSGIVYDDDAQVVNVHSVRRFAVGFERPGAFVTVRSL